MAKSFIVFLLVFSLVACKQDSTTEEKRKVENLRAELADKQGQIATQNEKIKSLSDELESLRQANTDLEMQLEEYYQPERLYRKGETALSFLPMSGII